MDRLDEFPDQGKYEPYGKGSEQRTDLAVSAAFDRITGALYGLVVGDALGVPVEFEDRERLSEDPVRNMRGWGTHQQPPGTWSDDSSLALCMVDSILHAGWNLEDQGKRFCQWLYEGYMTPHGEVFDVGGTTYQALSRIRMGVPPVKAGGRAEMDNGNGSLMRVLPAALYFSDAPIEMMIRSLSDASSLTHAHPRSRLACVLYSFVVRELLGRDTFGEEEPLETKAGSAWLQDQEPPQGEGKIGKAHSGPDAASKLPRKEAEGKKTAGKAVQRAIQRAADALTHLAREGAIPQDMQREMPYFQRVLDGSLITAGAEQIRSGGYVVDTLEASLWCVATSNSFVEAVLKAVNLGEDTDTTGAVAGGLAGALWGMGGITDEWIQTLARKEDLESWFSRFADLLVEPVPFSDSYWVLPGKLLAGEYPRTKEYEKSRLKLQSLLDSGITAIVDLTVEGESPYGVPLKPYHSLIQEIASKRGTHIEIRRFPIPDGGTVPPDALRGIHRWIDWALENGHSVYVHCWGGHGRTGLVVGTWLAEHGFLSGKTVFEGLRYFRRRISDPNHPSPESHAQREIVENWKSGGRRS